MAKISLEVGPFLAIFGYFSLDVLLCNFCSTNRIDFKFLQELYIDERNNEKNFQNVSAIFGAVLAIPVLKNDVLLDQFRSNFHRRLISMGEIDR